MSWYQYVVTFEEDKKEILNAFLLSIEADAILDNNDHFICYKNDPEDPEDFKNQIAHLPGVKGGISFKICEDKNWNAVWESNYEPVAIEDICYIRAEFHDRNDGLPYEIIIRPQMAFGTGHHETTSLMIAMMNSIHFNHCNTLDYGCGTGILSVFAAMKNSKFIKGIDIELPAVENSHIHQEINGLIDHDMKFELGGLEVLQNEKYEVILANINRQVLLDSKNELPKFLVSEGILLMSGILHSDEALILNAYSEDFILLEKRQKGEWMCFKWKLKN